MDFVRKLLLINLNKGVNMLPHHPHLVCTRCKRPMGYATSSGLLLNEQLCESCAAEDRARQYEKDKNLFKIKSTCSACGGTGYSLSGNKCYRCNGKGEI